MNISAKQYKEDLKLLKSLFDCIPIESLCEYEYRTFYNRLEERIDSIPDEPEVVLNDYDTHRSYPADPDRDEWIEDVSGLNG